MVNIFSIDSSLQNIELSTERIVSYLIHLSGCEHLNLQSLTASQANVSASESDKFIRSKFEQPKAGPKGGTQGWV